MKQKLYFFIAFFVINLSLFGQSSVVDQANNTYNDSHTIGTFFSSYIGQSFTCGATGLLTAISLPGYSGGPEDNFTLQIFKGSGFSGEIVATQLCTAASMALINFIPVSVTEGTMYTFKITESLHLIAINSELQKM